MRHNNVDLKVLIKGKPITEYAHRGSVYVEGREGSEYELEITNHCQHRVEAIISVDGLSIIDGKAAGTESVGYVLNAGQVAKIPGWMVDQATAAKFKFGAKQGSYATGSTGSSQNNGVIGLMVFSEQVRYQQPSMQTALRKNLNSRSYSVSGNEALSPFPIAQFYTGNGGSICSSNNTPVGLGLVGSGFTASVNNLSQTLSANATTADASYNPLSPVDDYYFAGAQEQAKTSAVNNLGTEFGEATDFGTKNVEFVRKDLLGVSVIYYDNKRGLVSRGVVMEKKRHVQQAPDAFPAMNVGCAVPVGWRK